MKHIKILTTLLILLIFSVSCDDEPIDVPKITKEEAIKVESELYQSIQQMSRTGVTEDHSDPTTIKCLEFDYPFTVLTYDEDLTFIEATVLNNDAQFSNFLGVVNEDLYVSISYPISGSLSNGQSVSLINNKELKEAIDNCVEEVMIGYCTGVMIKSQGECSWKINHSENGNNEFEESYFEISEEGKATFYHDDKEFDGTWIFIYTNGVFYSNIHFLEDDLIRKKWNFNWNMIIVNKENIVLEREDESGEKVSYSLSRFCEED